jgi:hypothetical protein
LRIAAFGIPEWTINFAVSIPVSKDPNFYLLGPTALQQMQNRWKPARLIVKDEKSMIGRTQMGKLD